MAATHGHPGEFDSNQEDWESYIERLQQYFTANDVRSADKQRAILLSCSGASTYRLMKSVLTPNRPTDVAFDDIVTQMKTHYSPPPSETVQRYLFNSRSHRAGESISTYVTELKKLAEHCNCGDTLEPMLRDRLVCGIGNEHWQHRLLAKDKLDYKVAMKLVLVLETAESQVKDLQGTTQVHQVRRSQHSQRSKRHGANLEKRSSCYRCGANHEPNKCRFKDEECHFCHKKGHITKVCWKKMRTSIANRTEPMHGTHTILEVEDDSEYSMYPLFSNKNPPLMVNVKLSKAKLQLEVDTEAHY